jgi:hypothetical protein
MGLGLGLSITSGGYISFLPTDISNLALWFQNGVGVTAAKWDDSSGNDNHATQSVEANRADVSGGGLDFEQGDSDHLQIKDGQTFLVKTNDPGVITTEIVCPSGTFGNQKQLILVNRTAGASNRFSVFKDGSEVTIDSDNSSNEAAGENPNGFDINVLGSKAGSSDFFDGIMFEVLFFDKGLSSTEISDLNDYLTSKHGL